MDMESGFRVGDLVWAKMKGFPRWPAKIVLPPTFAKTPKSKNSHFLYFFGSENYRWVSDEFISPHHEGMLDILNKEKNENYQRAIDCFICYERSIKEEKTSPPKTGKKKKKRPLRAEKKEESPHRMEREKKSPSRTEKENNCSSNDKKRKVENNDKNSQTEDIKVNDVSKKCERKVLAKKNPLRKCKKRTVGNIDAESSSYSPSEYHERKGTDCSESCSVDSEEKVPETINENTESYGDKHRPLPKIGFIGLGMMGKNIVKNFIMSGHDVTVWNRTMSKCHRFVSMGAKSVNTPAELVTKCDIIFCCVSGPEASKSIVYSQYGILTGLSRAERLDQGRKGYVEMTTIDPESSSTLGEAITMEHGMYLEAPLCGTSNDAENGSLIILAAGDRKLFSACETCFHAIGRYTSYISCETGSGNKMSLLLSMLSGTTCVALAEAMALAERLNLQKEDVVEILRMGPLALDTLKQKGRMMYEQSFKTVMPLKYMQKDMAFSLAMGNKVFLPLPVTAAANEVYKNAKYLFPDFDMTAVYNVLHV